ncbi:N-acetylmuramoyl-L-alanine amidase [Tumebacillus sp. BK434]|uniref:N-acetylmuramoyl-L-alanine amidase family protein n=1 Tax=Tumebacillus sp. BK434 TaxID=2512169 RepID=UPI0010456FE2|nr:N-acetylmuramoyl-L-alanine amidase [Tumebacillus sp. BK434]TCP59402.1 N-acetylmuramoyl-L-alanine amidase [Tumebacillus sp. BK434]
MKRFWHYALPLFLILVFAAFLVSPLSPAKKALTVPGKWPAYVMIDPGHGGYDPGVLSDGLREADLALSIGKELQKELADQMIPAVMTRSTDIDFAQPGLRGITAKRSDLARRVNMAFEQGATMYISLHANVSPLATRGGAEVFYPADLPEAKKLAEIIQKKLHALPGMTKRDAKAANYYLLRNQNIPALIIECGYLNISGDRSKLISPPYQRQLAQAIAEGVQEYLDSK